MEKVRLGIIGAGNMGSGHIGNYKKGLRPEVEITAVADRRQERRDWAKAELGDAVAVAHGALFAAVVVQGDKAFAAVIAVDHAEAVRRAQPLLGSKPASGDDCAERALR